MSDSSVTKYSVVENDDSGIHVVSEPLGIIIAEQFNDKADAELLVAALNGLA